LGGAARGQMLFGLVRKPSKRIKKRRGKDIPEIKGIAAGGGVLSGDLDWWNRDPDERFQGLDGGC